MFEPDDCYEIQGSVVLRCTRSRLLVRLDDQHVWIPRSQVIGGDSIEADEKDISVRARWAEENELV